MHPLSIHFCHPTFVFRLLFHVFLPRHLTHSSSHRYGMSYLLERTTYTPFEIYNDAGRRGRVGENCREIFSDCNDV